MVSVIDLLASLACFSSGSCLARLSNGPMSSRPSSSSRAESPAKERPSTAPARGRPDSSKGKKGKKKKAEEPPPLPPPPPLVALQVRSIAWRCMDFRCTVPTATPVSELRRLIKQRHGNVIEQMTLYHDTLSPDNRVADEELTVGSISFSRKGQTTSECYDLLYDYYPYIDPFPGRPFAAILNATNPEISLPVPGV